MDDPLTNLEAIERELAINLDQPALVIVATHAQQLGLAPLELANQLWPGLGEELGAAWEEAWIDVGGEG